jgi:hypothetical protein
MLSRAIAKHTLIARLAEAGKQLTQSQRFPLRLNRERRMRSASICHEADSEEARMIIAHVEGSGTALDRKRVIVEALTGRHIPKR